MTAKFSESLPPIANAKLAKVWFCKRSQKSLLRLLEKPVWIGVHWLSGRSRACEGKDCPADWHARPLNPKGYLPAMLCRTNLDSGQPEWVPVVAEISVDVGLELRGRVFGDLLVWLSRESKPKSPLRVEFYQPSIDEIMRLVPVEAWDVQPILWRLWNIRPVEENLPLDQSSIIKMENYKRA